MDPVALEACDRHGFPSLSSLFSCLFLYVLFMGPSFYPVGTVAQLCEPQLLLNYWVLFGV